MGQKLYRIVEYSPSKSEFFKGNHFKVQRRWFGFLWLSILREPPYRHPSWCMDGAVDMLTLKVMRRGLKIKEKIRYKQRRRHKIVHYLNPIGRRKRISDSQILWKMKILR